MSLARSLASISVEGSLGDVTSPLGIHICRILSYHDERDGDPSLDIITSVSVILQVRGKVASGLEPQQRKTAAGEVIQSNYRSDACYV